MALNQTFNQDPSGDIGVSGAVSTGAPTYTTGTQAAVSLTVAGAVRTDSSAVTQPVSATALPLPTGAATSALQTTGNTTLATISGQLPATLGQTTMAGSLAVTIASNQSALQVSPVTSATANLTSVTASATSVTVLASNTARKGCIVTNDSTAILYLAFSATSSTTAYSLKMFPNSAYITDTLYTGVISGIWAAANGAARVTEFV